MNWLTPFTSVPNSKGLTAQSMLIRARGSGQLIILSTWVVDAGS